MSLTPLLAHGNLGYWDELIFISVAIIFLGMMGLSWLRSRNLDAELAHPPQESSAPSPAQPSTGDARFELD